MTDMITQEAQRMVSPSLPAPAQRPLPSSSTLPDPHGQENLATAALHAPTSRIDVLLTSTSTYRWVAFYRAPEPAEAASEDDLETQLIASDPEFYGRLVTRLNRPGRLIPAEEILGDLDSDDES